MFCIRYRLRLLIRYDWENHTARLSWLFLKSKMWRRKREIREGSGNLEAGTERMQKVNVDVNERMESVLDRR